MLTPGKIRQGESDCVDNTFMAGDNFRRSMELQVPHANNIAAFNSHVFEVGREGHSRRGFVIVW